MSPQVPQARAWRRVASLLAGVWLLATPAAHAAGEPPPPRRVECSFEGMLEDVRRALKLGSPAYQRYVAERLREAARAMPPEQLLAAVGKERDPAVLEVLGSALSARMSYSREATLLQPLLTRAMGDSDPALRAAAVRGLRGIGSVEAMSDNGNVVTYEQLIRDSAPEVREAVVDNLVHENAKVYFGHDRAVSEMAVAAAETAKDPAVAARLLSQVSMEQVGPETVQRLYRQLREGPPEVRTSAAQALGGVPGRESAGARDELLALYKSDADPAVRKAALEGLVRLGLGSARPQLESLRGVAPSLDPEIDAWLAALKLGIQEWNLLLKQKQRMQK